MAHQPSPQRAAKSTIVGFMVQDWRSSLTVDPELPRRGVVVQAIRFTTRDQPDVDDDFRYEFAAAIRREGKRWPKGQYVLHAYDESGALLTRAYVDEHKTLDKDLRQLSESFYAVRLAKAELIFEAEGAKADADSWDPVTVRVVDALEPLGIEVEAAKAESHPDFEYNNMLIVRITGRVLPVSGLPFPSGLCVQVTILDEAGAVLNSSQLDLRVGPSSARPIETEVKIYNHQEPDVVVLEAFTV